MDLSSRLMARRDAFAFSLVEGVAVGVPVPAGHAASEGTDPPGQPAGAPQLGVP